MIPATGELAYRVAKDRYTLRSGPLSSLVNRHVGRLPPDVNESRGRFDTLGRTVYFGDSPECCFAEVLQGFRMSREMQAADAQAAGQDVDQYLHDITADALSNDIDPPWAVSGDWQASRSLLHIRMPLEGWWVQIDHPDTLNALNDALAADLRTLGVGLLTSSIATSENRPATTLIAQHVRELTLEDGSLPLGISFRSKTEYGRCLAWWNRREDDDLLPADEGPSFDGRSDNVFTPAFQKICSDWGLPILQVRSAW
ncbi:RES domain-containing protein [Sanguibacter sp. YZGR15]|uniref:RES domain-containing protein n=2 Tax=Sanguibacter suaedae TaxID=2795737 RepID=A0A934I9P8_9MICO|nr:RES domain-containing protein [Sanguibacter suaedae]